MCQTIVSGNKPSSVALNQNHAIVFIDNIINTKSQYKKKLSGLMRSPQLIISIKLITGNFEYDLKVRIDRNQPQYHI